MQFAPKQLAAYFFGNLTCTLSHIAGGLPPPALDTAPDQECSISLVGAAPSGRVQPPNTLAVSCRGSPGGVQLLLSPWLQAAAAASTNGSAPAAQSATRDRSGLPDVRIGGVEVAGAPEEGPGRGSGGSGEEAGDWRLALVCSPGTTHLRLYDSLVWKVPLSTRGPVLQLVGCGAVSFDNVTLTELTALPGASADTAPAYGAVHARGLVAGARLSGVECSEVAGSHTWACFLLSFEEDVQGREGEQPALLKGTVEIADSLFSNTNVTARVDRVLKTTALMPSVAAALKPNQLLGGGLGGGCGGGMYGAVVVGSAPRTIKTAVDVGGGSPPPGVVTVRVVSSSADGCTGGCGGVLAVTCPVVSVHMGGRPYLLRLRCTLGLRLADSGLHAGAKASKGVLLAGVHIDVGRTPDRQKGQPSGTINPAVLRCCSSHR